MNPIKVIDRDDLVRDPNSKAILSKDAEALNKYKEERDLRRKLAVVANEYDDLKKDVGEIKSMLKLILERNI